MSEQQGIQRFFGGCGCGFGGGGLIILLIIGAILLLGDDLLEWLFCDDMALIWIVLLILLLTNFGFDGVAVNINKFKEANFSLFKKNKKF